MSENVIRCSKCGGTVSGGTCTACGATGQSIKCEHCGSDCPSDSRWCPSCGRHLSTNPAAPPGESALSAGGSIYRLIFLFGLMVVACYLIWRLTPAPAAAAWSVLALGFLLAPGTLWRRMRRGVALFSGSLLAAGVIGITSGGQPPAGTHFLVPQRAQIDAGAVQAPRPTNGDLPFVPGVIIARFMDNGPDPQVVEDAISQPYFQTSGGESVFAPSGFTEETNAEAHDIEIFGPRILEVGSGFTEETDPDTHDVTIRFLDHVQAGDLAEIIQALRSDPRVVFAEPDFIVHLDYTPNDPYFDEPYDSSKHGKLDQWYLRKIQAPRGWDALRNTKSQVRLAIIDTGIDYNHPDLKAVMARDSKGNLIGKNFVSSRGTPMDDNGHGTHCAGIAAAQTDNGVGVAGVGFNSFKLVPAKVLTAKGYGEVGWICRAITWCADNGCKVESMSLGAGIYVQAIQDAINYAWSKGVIVVAAAGNESSSRPSYPAGGNHVVAVSATDEQDQLAGFSNYGTPICVGAPGVHILATLPTYPCELTKTHGFKEGYDSLNGTSMACPVVSGVMAALLAYQPTLKPSEAIQRLEATADNTGGAPNGGWEMRFGHGRVNLANVLANHRRDAKVGSFYGQVVGPRQLALQNVTVRCEGQQVVTPGNGMFRLANLKPGNYTVEATFQDRKVTTSAAIVPGADTCLTLEIRN